jgi:hypothetical protein
MKTVIALVLLASLSTQVVAEDLINVGAMGYLRGGTDTLNVGFVAENSESTQVLIQAKGPSLGLRDAVPDPYVEVVRLSDRQVIAVSDNWQDHPSASLIRSSGFDQYLDYYDAALVVALPSGSYTVKSRDALGRTGRIQAAVTNLGKLPDSEPSTDLTGRWTGSATSRAYPGCGSNLTVDLVQSGDSVSGSGTAVGNCLEDGSDSGQISGTVSDDGTLTFGLVYDAVDSLSFSGQVSGDGNAMNGTYTWPAEADYGDWSLQRR